MDSIEDISICSGGNNVDEDNDVNDTTEVGFIALKFLHLSCNHHFKLFLNLRLEICFYLSRNCFSFYMSF